MRAQLVALLLVVGIAAAAGARAQSSGGDGGGVGVSDHGALTGLADDDHAQYALLAGRSGQVANGGSATGQSFSLHANAAEQAVGAGLFLNGGDLTLDQFGTDARSPAIIINGPSYLDDANSIYQFADHFWLASTGGTAGSHLEINSSQARLFGESAAVLGVGAVIFTVQSSGGTFTGPATFTGAFSVDNAQGFRLLEDDANGSNYVEFVAPAALTSNTTCTLENDGNPIPDSCVGDGTDASGGVSGLGSTDNAIVRADGTGGGAAQGSDITVSDVASSKVTIASTAGNSIALQSTADGLVVVNSAAGTPRLVVGEIIGSRYGMSYPGGTAFFAVANDGTTLFERSDLKEFSNTSNARWMIFQTSLVGLGLSTVIGGYSNNDPQQGSLDSGMSRAAAGVWADGTGAAGNRLGWRIGGGSCVVASDQTNATTTPQTWACYVTGTTAITLVAGRSYRFHCQGFLSDSVAVDGAAVDFDAGTATATTFRQQTTAFDTALNLSTQTTALATDVAASTFTGSGAFEIHGYIKVNAAGTWQPRFMQAAHTTGTATLAEGSNCLFTDVTP